MHLLRTGKLTFTHSKNIYQCMAFNREFLTGFFIFQSFSSTFVYFLFYVPIHFFFKRMSECVTAILSVVRDNIWYNRGINVILLFIFLECFNINAIAYFLVGCLFFHDYSVCALKKFIETVCDRVWVCACDACMRTNKQTNKWALINGQ